MSDDMHRHTLYAELRSLEPLHLGARHPYGLFRSSETIVRGGRVLAALAQLSGGLLFGGGHNIIVEDAPVLADGGRFEDEVVHLPLTAETCKAFVGTSWHDPDYLAQQDKGVPHGVWDTLLLRWLAARAIIANPSEPLWGRCPKPECRGSTKPYFRFMQRRKEGSDAAPRYRYEECEAKLERRAHTALNLTRGTAEFGLLFADELIVLDTTFYLRIRVQGQTRQELADRVREIKSWERSRFRLGGAKSRGHGLVEITRFARDDETPETEPLDERLRRFDGLVKHMADGELEPERNYFTLTLQAPLILPDQDVHPNWCIREGNDGDWTRLFPGIAALPMARLEFIQHRFTQVTGWSSVWQLPKPAQRALAAGSVYVFSTTAKLEDVEPVAMELEFTGAGLCRAEGFGAIYISDPFHREVITHGSTT